MRGFEEDRRLIYFALTTAVADDPRPTSRTRRKVLAREKRRSHDPSLIVTEPSTPIPGWPQPGDPRPPRRGGRARLVINALWITLFLWLLGGLPVLTMLTIRNEEGFVQLVWVWLVGMVAWSLALFWARRRTSPH